MGQLAAEGRREKNILDVLEVRPSIVAPDEVTDEVQAEMRVTVYEMQLGEMEMVHEDGWADEQVDLAGLRENMDIDVHCPRVKQVTIWTHQKL